MKRNIILFVCMLSIMYCSAQTENPYGLYRLQSFNYENGNKKVPTFEQYKYCGIKYTLTLSVTNQTDHSTTFDIRRNDKESLQYTGKRPLKDTDKSTQVYDSNRRKFTMSWYNTSVHGDYFPFKEWITEQYDSEEGINPNIKEAVALFGNVVLNGVGAFNGNDSEKLSGCWRAVGNWTENEHAGYIIDTSRDYGAHPNYYIINSLYWISLPVYDSSDENFSAGCEIDVYKKLTKNIYYLSADSPNTPDFTFVIRWLTDDAIIVQYNDYPQELWVRSALPSFLHKVIGGF